MTGALSVMNVRDARTREDLSAFRTLLGRAVCENARGWKQAPLERRPAAGRTADPKAARSISAGRGGDGSGRREDGESVALSEPFQADDALCFGFVPADAGSGIFLLSYHDRLEPSRLHEACEVAL
jgi:hypothetical protein